MIKLHLLVGEPVIQIRNSNLYNSEGITSNDPAYIIDQVMQLDPKFIKDGTYLLKETSPLQGKGDDEKDLGIIK